MARTAAMAAGGAVAAVAGVFLAKQGLDRADKWASVVGLFLNAVGVVIAAVGVRLSWPKRTPPVDELSHRLGVTPLQDGDPNRIGEFGLLGRLGSGATGVVYLGVDSSGGFAAVKVMHAELARDFSFRERFKREIRDVQNVEQADKGKDYFPTLLGSNADAERPWLATQYLPGLTLSEVVTETGPQPLPTVAWLAHGVAKRLRMIHELGLVHRDLKPSNVLLDVDDSWVIDLGIAKAAQDAGLTRTGGILGTPAFMAPEQLHDGQISSAADVFSLGSLLVYAATSAPPFGTGSAYAVMRAIIDRDPDLGLLAGSDDEIVGLIRRCLDKEPSNRPTADDIVTICARYAAQQTENGLPEHLRERIAERRTALAPATSPPPDSILAPRATRKRLAIVSGMASLVLVASLVIWQWPFSVSPNGGGPSPSAVSEWRSALASCGGPADTDLHISSSSDIYPMLGAIAKDYGVRTVNDHCVRIAVSEVNRGTTVEDLANCWPNTNKPRPDVWIPASTVRLEVARAQATNSRCRDAFPSQALPVVTNPTVIAMPEEMARQLGWPNQDIGWSDLAKLAVAPDGWASRGRRDWGRFRLGKTNPHTSSSGLHATIGMFYAGRPDSRNRKDPLTEADVSDEAAKEFVRKIESSIVHYGEDTLRFLANLRQADDEGRALDYISAVIIGENSMLAYNEGYPTGAWSDKTESKRPRPRTKLVAIYPEEGTITHDHPYVQFTWPSTNSAEVSAKQQVAGDFLSYLRTPAVQKRFQDIGYRDHEGRAGRLASLENGIAAQAGPHGLTLPEASVLNLVLSTWNEVRKPARVLLAVDTSTSMGEGVTNENTGQPCPPELKHPEENRCLTKLELLQNQREYILSSFTERDQLGLWEFSEHPNRLVDIVLMNEAGKERIRAEFGKLRTAPYTALYETIAAAVTEVATGSHENTINAVVVLTDGHNDPPTSPDPLLAQLRQQPVRVFTIAYGHQADATVLQRIADTSKATHYDARNPNDIGELLVAAIISNF